MEVKINNLDYIKDNKKIIDDFSYTFKSGTVTSIIGESGSGKSTLLDLINYLSIITSGSISIGNIKIKGKLDSKLINKLRFNVGLLFQNKEVSFFEDTVEKEVGFSLKYFNYKVYDSKKRVSDALKLVKLNDDYLQLNPFNLSLGEKTKVALASILITNPKVILLDEPTIGLDGKSIKNLIRLIKKLKELNRTIIICSNDTYFINEVSDDIIVLNKGSIVLNDSIENIFKYVSILEENNIEIPKIIEFIDIVKRKKQVCLNTTLDIKDIIKDIIRNV